MADEIEVISNKLPQIIGALHLVGRQKTQKAATAIVLYAISNHEYQSRTGQAATAFYTVMKGYSTYGDGFVEGDGRAGSEILEEVAPPDNDQTAYVANASGHFAFLELGTVNMPPYPSLIPALEAVRAAFESGAGWESALAQLVSL
jgi:hypothetical protein